MGDDIDKSLPWSGLSGSTKALKRHMTRGRVAWRMQWWYMSVMELIIREGVVLCFLVSMISS